MKMRRDAGTDPEDALDLLRVDHRRISRLFRQYARWRALGDVPAGVRDPGEFVDEICTELLLHARLEEEIFYPAARRIPELADFLDEAEVEHGIVGQLVAQLNTMEPGDELYNARVKVLGEYVQHHVREEEKRIFPRVRSAGLDLAALAREIRRRQRDLRIELGLLDDIGPDNAAAALEPDDLDERDEGWFGGMPERRSGGIGADADHDDDYTDESGGVVGAAEKAERPARPH